MSDPISVASATIALLDYAAKTLLQLAKSRVVLDDFGEVEQSIRVGLQKYQTWQENWSGQAQRPEITSEALWGIEGWARIRTHLAKIMDICNEIQNCISKLKEKQDNRSKLKSALKSSRSTKQRRSKLKELTQSLNNEVDKIWMYSETVFDSLHGVMSSQELKYTSRDRLLTLAVHSRAGSLQLYMWCAMSPLDCSLAMDLLDAGPDLFGPASPPQLDADPDLFGPASLPQLDTGSDLFGPASPPQDHEALSMHLFYQLFTRSDLADPTALNKVVVESLPATESSSNVIQAESSDLQLFEPKVETTLIRVASQGTGPSSCLRIPKAPVTKVRLRSKPEKLASVLDRLESANTLSVGEHFSTQAKIELAFKIVESGFFLLGTPWFSSLSSTSVRRLKSIGRQRHSFVLEIQTLEFDDLLFDDPNALTEITQLFRIGILLMEIALNKSKLTPPLERDSDKMDAMKLLPQVEKNMGAQYCKATAFCLQLRQARSDLRGKEKYSSTHFHTWESYLAEFLQEYHTQVFLRYYSSNREFILC